MSRAGRWPRDAVAGSSPGKRAEAITVAREIMESGPLTYEHAVPYANLIFAAGHLDEAVAVDEQFRAIDPLAMFHSRSLQWDYIAARRYDEAEAEYRRSLTLEGSHFEPALVAFLRMLAHKDADLKALRALPPIPAFGAIPNSRNC